MGLIDVASLAAFVLPLGFIALYVSYGGRFRSPVGKAIMIKAAGASLLGLTSVLRYIFGLRASTSTAGLWVQTTGLLLFCIGIVWVIVLTVRTNGRLPWQKEDPPA